MILITGGSGQLGSSFRALIPDAVAPDRASLDLARLDDLESVIERIQPTAIVNCAAYTGVEAAESDTATADLVNGVAVGVLAKTAGRRGIPFVTFSTDYVFDGSGHSPYLESSEPNPLNAYGSSKLLGERAALTANPKALVVRTSWVFSATHRDFVTTILAEAKTGPVEVVTDQLGCPTYAPDLAAATMTAMAKGATGLLHITNAGAASWFDLARVACETAGIDPGRIRPTTTDRYPTLVHRPRYSVLGSERRARLGIVDLRPWQEAVVARNRAV